MNAHLPSLSLLALALPVAAQTQPVELYYDLHGIAHIFGATDEAAMYGYGYHQMREYPIGTLDRLWRFSGRMSEVAGPTYLDEDYQIRLWDVPALVARDQASIPPDILRMVKAYVAGLNDGRAFWAAGGVVPSQSPLLRLVLGTETDPDRMLMRFDPLPDYLNQGFHPFQFDPLAPGSVRPDYDPDDVPRYMERIIDRLFAPELPITLEHVLSLAIVVNSAPGLLYTASEVNQIPDDTGLTNAWLASAQATGGPVTTLNDPHTGRDKLTTRPHFVQIHGDRYRVSGIAAPGVSIYSGFSDHVSWVLSGSSENDALQRTSWDVRLLDSAPLGFRYASGKAARHELGTPVSRRVELIAETDSLSYFDPVASIDLDADGLMDPGEVVYRTQTRTRHYVPDESGLGLPNDRYPVTRVAGHKADGLALPEPGDTIRFRAGTFQVARNHWEFWVRLGRVRFLDGAPPGEDEAVAILRDVNTGWDNNYLLADYRNSFYYQYLAIAPRLSPSLLATLTPEDLDALGVEELVLDGGDPGQRWQGFHDFDSLPRIGPTAITTPEAWVANNPTPDHIELGPAGNGVGQRFTAADLAAVPDEIMGSRSRRNWRQLRGRELLQTGLLPGSLAGVSESAAADVTDTRARSLWPFFVRARDIKAAELVPSDPDYQWLDEVDLFIQWVETHRHLGPDGLSYEPGRDFEAHPYSLITPYTTLLVSWFAAARDAATSDPELRDFGEDTLHPLLALGPGAMVRPDHDVLIEALWDALVGGPGVDPGVAPLWKLGSGSGGLANHVLFLQAWNHPAWAGDPRYSDTQASVDPLFAADMGGTRVTRWGLVNQLVVTPHAFLPGRSALNPAQRSLAQLYTALRPDLIAGFVSSDPVVERLKFPLYEQQMSLAFPLAGTEESLFVTRNSHVTQGASPLGAHQALYRSADAPPFQYYYYMPHDQGSQVLLLAELSDPPSARGKFLSATGPTELSIPILPGQDRFSASADFASRTWRDLETDETVLAATATHHEHLDYTPVP